MCENFDLNAKIFKALGDSSRLKIIDILSCEEMCACDILKYFDFTQPTLSHHMKVLTECGIVVTRKEGTWNYYRLSCENSKNLINFLNKIITNTSKRKCVECKEKE